MLCNNASVHIEKLTNRFLCQPYIMILHTDFNPILVGIHREHKEIYGTVSNLKFPVLICGHYISPSNHLSSDLFCILNYTISLLFLSTVNSERDVLSIHFRNKIIPFPPSPGLYPVYRLFDQTILYRLFFYQLSVRFSLICLFLLYFSLLIVFVY